jgi:hypothetical protein
MILKPFIPSYPLNEHIDKLWVFESSNGIPLQDMRLIVPNGLFKIIIPYRNGISSTINGKFTLAKESSIAMIGIADTHAIINSQTEEDFGSIGIEFKPFSAYRFFRIPMKELTNQVYGIDELLGKEGRQLQSDLSGAASP